MKTKKRTVNMLLMLVKYLGYWHSDDESSDDESGVDESGGVGINDGRRW